MKFTNENNIILQTFANVEMIRFLKSKKFIQSEYFDTTSKDWYLKGVFKEIDIDNQGSLLMSLYAMVVVPKEILKTEFPDEFEKIECFLEQKLVIVKNTYKDSEHLRHLRNSIAHARIEFEGSRIIFMDMNKSSDYDYKANMKLSDVQEFMDILKKIHESYRKGLGE